MTQPVPRRSNRLAEQLEAGRGQERAGQPAECRRRRGRGHGQAPTTAPGPAQAPGPAPAPGPPHPVALDLVEAQANFTFRIGVRECTVCSEEVSINNLHVLLPCGHASMCTEWAAEGWQEDENGQMKLYCPFDRAEATQHMGLLAWLAEKSAENFGALIL